jgi:single-strand DNA-binding protein
MAEGLNRVMLLGNLGADPELRYTQGGQAVLNMRLATTESYLDKDKVRRERTDWHAVVVWGKRGEALGKFLTKGSTIFVEGSIRTSSYDDKEGNKRYKTEIVAQNVILAGGRGGGAGARNQVQDDPSAYEQRAPRSGGGGYGGGGGGGGRAPAQDAGPPGDDFGYGGGGGGAGGGGNDDDIPF